MAWQWRSHYSYSHFTDEKTRSNSLEMQKQGDSHPSLCGRGHSLNLDATLPPWLIFQSPTKASRDHFWASETKVWSPQGHTAGCVNLPCKHRGLTMVTALACIENSLCDRHSSMCTTGAGTNAFNCHTILPHRCNYYLQLRKLRSGEVK